MMVNLFVKGSITLVLSILIFANSAFAFGPHFRHGFSHRNPEKRADKMVERIADEIKLDVVQIETLNQIKNELLAKKTTLKIDKRKVFEYFMVEMGKETFDRSKFQNLIDNHAAKVMLETGFFTEKLVAFHKMLTPVQRELVVEKMKEMKQNREDRKKGWFYKSPEERSDMVVSIVSDRLDLSEEQFVAVTKVKNDLLKSKADLLGEDYFHALFDKVSQQFVTESLNSSEIQQDMNASITRVEKMMDVVLLNLSAVHQILTPEQRELIVEHMQNRQHRFKRR